MSVDLIKTGETVAHLRKQKNLTQLQLAERLNISFQAVSKWERGESLPDTALLVDLADILETSVDYILTAGKKAVAFSGKITVEEMRRGLLAFKEFGDLTGKENVLYRCAADGINSGMNTDIEKCFEDDYVFEAFLAEAVIQNIKAGKYVDLTDVKKNFSHSHFCSVVTDFASKHGIK